MQLRPIIFSLRHHKLTVLLLILQVALTYAIVCNVAFMIINRAGQMSLPSGVAEKELSMVTATSINPRENMPVRQAEDLATLRAITGVKAAAAVNSLPLSGNRYGYAMCGTQEARARSMQARAMVAGCTMFTAYSGTPGSLATLGLRLVAGRDFLADEYATGDKLPPSVIVSRNLAEHILPGKSALGHVIYLVPGNSARIVGVVDTLLAPDLRQDGSNQFTMLWPELPNGSTVTYVMRSAPDDRERVLKAAVQALVAIDPQRLIPAEDVQTFAHMRQQYFERDITMIGLLLASVLGLLFVTALGIAGLASFWVGQRRRSIGIRRALGATRSDILRYFQTENFLIVSAGVLVGAVLAVGVNLWLMQRYELTRLPWFYLLIGAVAIWLLGQLAVLGPALRAARVPPVVATRSV